MKNFNVANSNFVKETYNKGECNIQNIVVGDSKLKYYVDLNDKFHVRMYLEKNGNCKLITDLAKVNYYLEPFIFNDNLYFDVEDKNTKDGEKSVTIRVNEHESGKQTNFIPYRDSYVTYKDYLCTVNTEIDEQDNKNKNLEIEDKSTKKKLNTYGKDENVIFNSDAWPGQFDYGKIFIVDDNIGLLKVDSTNDPEKKRLPYRYY